MTVGVDSVDLIRLVEVVMLVVVGVVFILVVLRPLVAMIVVVTPQIIAHATAPHESPPPPSTSRIKSTESTPTVSQFVAFHL